jgi:GNAT superfamily N-acetyltransferase
MLKLVEMNKRKNDTEKVRKLYNDAFPLNERLPFTYLANKSSKGNGSVFYLAYNDEVLSGLAYVIIYQDMVYLFYLAVVPEFRNKGTGSQILERLKDMYSGKRIVLDIERNIEKEENIKSRRKRFYQKNGFAENQIYTKAIGVRFEALYYGGEVTENEYEKLLSSFIGHYAFKLFFKFEN